MMTFVKYLTSGLEIGEMGDRLHEICDSFREFLQLYRSKLLQFQRFPPSLKLILLVPLALYLLLFKLSSYIPSIQKPSIDVSSLPNMESYILFGLNLQGFPKNFFGPIEQVTGVFTFLDLIAAGVYILHFGFWIFFTLYLYYYYRFKLSTQVLQPWTFLWSLGILNIMAIITQLLWPTAPPWYNDVYGTRPANYGMEGNAAGLENADEFLRIPLFENIYESSPIVFGSFPSLHAAWPLIMCFFGPTVRVKGILSVYASMVCWAAVYLNHHYVVDLLGALLYAIISFLVGSFTAKYIHALFTGKLNKKRCKELEKVIIESDVKMKNTSWRSSEISSVFDHD